MSRAKFANNNQIDTLAAANITASSAMTYFPFSNTQSSARYESWVPAGNFTVTTSNNKIYINDGSDKTASITVGSYTYATLPTAIASALNAVSVSWLCLYDTDERKFTIYRSIGTPVTMRWSVTTDAAWDMLGYDYNFDYSSSAFQANRSRNHTSESVIWDLGAAKAGDFFACVSQMGLDFPISDQATITLKANSVNSFTSPPVSITLTRTASGIFSFNDAVSSPTYRYWKFEFIDRENTVGPEGFPISHFYLGDYDTLTSTNFAIGFEKNLVDLTEKKTSQAGASFFRSLSKRWAFESCEIQNLTETERLMLQNFFALYGIESPFYLSLDSSLLVSTTIDELTKFVRFTSSPTFRHLIRDIYTMAFSLEEVI